MNVIGGKGAQGRKQPAGTTKQHDWEIVMKIMVPSLIGLTAGAVFLAGAASPAGADAISDYYKKTRMKLVIGFSPGGGFDRGGRVVARHIYKYIPGTPKIIVQNMPGGGSVRALNWLYTKGPKDGSVISHFHPAALREAFIGAAGAFFKPREFYWLGSYNRERSVTYVRTDSGVKTIQDAMKKEVVIGATSARSGGGVYPRILNYILGTKFKVVVGYGSTGESTLATERGEVMGVGSWSWTQLRDRRPKWIKSGFVVPIVQHAVAKHPDLPHVPTPLDLAKNDADRQVLEAILMWQELGRPFAAPPGTDPVRGKALRKAFDIMVTKKDFEVDIKKASLEVVPIDAKGAEELLAKLYSYPKEVVQRARIVYAEMRNLKVAKAKKKKANGLTIAGIKGKGRKMNFTFKDASGKTWKFKAQEKRLSRKTKINGKNGKAGQLKKGMVCSVSYYGKGGLIYSATCKG
jgi:tripartite-type tricarboxylate transporter receptor subunit TctC